MFLLQSWRREAAKFYLELSILDVKCAPPSKHTVPDLYITMLSPLQSRGYANEWLSKITYRHLIIDESHTWVRGRAGNEKANQLRFLREHLLPKAETVWHLSGTVFPAETKFDLQQTLMSLATNRVRKL